MAALDKQTGGLREMFRIGGVVGAMLGALLLLVLHPEQSVHTVAIPSEYTLVEPPGFPGSETMASKGCSLPHVYESHVPYFACCDGRLLFDLLTAVHFSVNLN